MTRWVMALGEKDPERDPSYASLPDLADARASVVVKRFEQLFPIVHGWKEIYGPEITCWAMSYSAELGIEEIQAAWSDITMGPWIRLDRQQGGYIKVSDYRGCEPEGESLFPPPDLPTIEADPGGTDAH
ncbi:MULTISPECIES: hypothetical protein [unclassified Streptomyces]|uniref:hypothetical protein n=1 Tax=unclassified Streptomyces TaxID=2593676 RepID=UPI0022AF5922|nr:MULTISPECIES: hypothetical protein [unclassified Streptomyces]MCZ4097300.1 hypothetical protein [Streptomyces sp. H39-C1]MCZ4120604.1 hypothetical protein [Streptomyces sp. H39-S7]